MSAFLALMLYSFAGWLYESTLCSLVNEKRLINRGFLYGPVCPIYGVGVLLCYEAFRGVQNPYVLFALSSVLCTAVEYLTACTLEHLFHKRWWDYSGMPFQIKGRVCLAGALLFGAGSVVTTRYVHPYVLSLLVNAAHQEVLFVMVLTLFLLDLSATMNSWLKFSRILKALHEACSGTARKLSETADTFVRQYTARSVTVMADGIRITVNGTIIFIHQAQVRFLSAFRQLEVRFAGIEVISRIRSCLKEKAS